MGFNLEGHEGWLEKYRKIWVAVEEQVFQTFTKDPVNKEWYIKSKMKGVQWSDNHQISWSRCTIW